MRASTFIAAIATTGCVLLAVALVVAVRHEFYSSPGPLSFKVTSAAAGARFRVRSSRRSSEWIACPGIYSDEKPDPIYEHSNPLLYVDVSIASDEYHGRLPLEFHDSFFVDRTELIGVVSLDGSAFVVRNGDVFFFPPVTGRSLVSCSLWSEKSWTVDKESKALVDQTGVEELSAGRHLVETESWRFDLDSPEGFSVDLFEWGKTDDVALSFDLQRDQFESAQVTFDGGERVALDKLDWFPGFRADHSRFDLVGLDGARFSLEVTRKRPNTHMSVRVSREPPK